MTGVCPRGGEVGSSVIDASGDGICCIFLELGPLLNGFLLDFGCFSGDDVRSVGFESFFRRLITVPSRRRPPIAPFFFSVAAYNHVNYV